MNGPVTIVMTTWFTQFQRLHLAEQTLESWKYKLLYSGELRLHVADDGSTLNFEPEKIWDGPVTYSKQFRHGVGASLNKGFAEAYKTSPYIFYGVDDWILQEPFDLDPWIRLLREREDVGIVRLGPPHPNLKGTIETLTEDWQGWGLRLDRYGLTVGDRPMLVHKRWTDYYGWRKEDCNAQECERLESVKYADMPEGPSIIYAVYHPWFHYHLDTVPSTSHIEPGVI